MNEQIAEFEQGFRELCIKHGLPAAFVILHGDSLITGGCNPLCNWLDRVLVGHISDNPAPSH